MKSREILLITLYPFTIGHIHRAQRLGDSGEVWIATRMASLACASASAAASGRTRISTPSTGRGASGTASSSCREMMTSMPSSARRSSGYRPRRHVAFVSADGAVDDVPSSSASEQQMAVSSTATRQSGASTSSVLNSLPAIPPSQLEEEYLMGSRLEREQWFPVAFASDLGEGTMIPFDLFNVPWVAFRDEKGQAGCVKDECAHRACPISLGKLVEGKVQCPYHGWEYTTGGECVKMPSIKKLLPDVFVDAAPVVERDGLLRVWAGKWSTDMDVQQAALQKLDSKALACPDRFTTMAEVTVELEMEAHEVMERLMDLAGRSTSTEKVDFTRIDAAIANDDVFPKIIAGALRSLRTASPKETSFLPSRVLESRVALEGGGGDWNIHQMHVVLPSRPGKCRVLFRMSTDFVLLPQVARSIGGRVWSALAEMVLHEQLEDVRGNGGAQESSAAETYQKWMREVSTN